MKKSAIDQAIEKVQGEIDVLEAVLARLIETRATKPATRAPRKPRIKAVESPKAVG